jgi:hypothetical protein
MPRSCGKQGAAILLAGPKSISSPSGSIRLLQSRHRRLPSWRSASNTHSEILDIPSEESGKFRSQCDSQLTASFLPLCPKTHIFCPQDVVFSSVQGKRMQ